MPQQRPATLEAQFEKAIIPLLQVTGSFVRSWFTGQGSRSKCTTAEQAYFWAKTLTGGEVARAANREFIPAATAC